MSTRNLSKDVSRVVRGLLAERRVTVQEFAGSIGLPNTTVARWINQRGISDTDGLETVAAGLSKLDGLEHIDVPELLRLAILSRPQGHDPDGIVAAIDRVRPPRTPRPRVVPQDETGT